MAAPSTPPPWCTAWMSAAPVDGVADGQPHLGLSKGGFLVFMMMLSLTFVLYGVMTSLGTGLLELLGDGLRHLVRERHVDLAASGARRSGSPAPG